MVTVQKQKQLTTEEKQDKKVYRLIRKHLRNTCFLMSDHNIEHIYNSLCENEEFDFANINEDIIEQTIFVESDIGYLQTDEPELEY